MQACCIIIQKGQSRHCFKACISFVHQISNEVGCLQQGGYNGGSPLGSKARKKLQNPVITFVKSHISEPMNFSKVQVQGLLK